jgi:hypothetical protein
MSASKTARIAIAVVLAAMTLVVASPAAAEPTVLCKANEEHCSSESTWPLYYQNFKGAIGEAPSEAAELVMPGLVTVSCSTGKLASTLEETEGPLVGEVAKWNFFNCVPSGCALAVPKELETGYSAEVTATGGGNGILKVGLTPVLIATCSKFTCTYGASTMQFVVEGGPGEGEYGHISSEALMSKVLLESSFSCPSTATYASLYQIVEPGFSTFVTH